MTVVGVPEHELARLRPRDVAHYLRSRGWTPGSRIRYSRRWEREWGGQRHRVLLPLDSELTDYTDRMADLIGALSATEGRPPSAVHQDLTLTGLDVQYIRTMPRTPSGTIPVQDGVLAVTSARDLLMAAACDTVAEEHRLVQPRRKPQRAKDFVESARFGPSAPGSYIFTVQVPLPEATSEGSLFEDVPDLDVAPEPFARQVSRRMFEAVTAARTAAERAAVADDSAPFAEGVEHGISADLCEALAGIGGQDSRSSQAGAAIASQGTVSHSTSFGHRDGECRTRARSRNFLNVSCPFYGKARRICGAENPTWASPSWAVRPSLSVSPISGPARSPWRAD